jgi:S-adenosyl-L-methionine hydrolase (adenosine-forming)
LRRVTLLTDFGTADGYVAVMKGILATRAPGVPIIDAGHGVRQGDVDGAARALGRYWAHFPPGTVHLVVVDPGVGTERRPLALEARGRWVVAPDNGIVTEVLRQETDWHAVALTHVDPPAGTPSRTFHGRDLFAPAAAHLASGGSLEGLGPVVDRPLRLARSVPRRHDDGRAEGRVVAVDHFGNLLTDLPGEWLGSGDTIEIAGRRIGAGGTYGEVEEGQAVALVNSDGLVEIAVRNGSAARALEVGPSAAVKLVPGRG